MARVLIVEDEMLVAMLLEDMLVDLGHEPVGPVMRVDAALRAVAEEAFDIAVLDINLAGKVSFPVVALPLNSAHGALGSVCCP